jgi:hypothetical protein
MPSEWTAASGPRITSGNLASRCRFTHLASYGFGSDAATEDVKGNQLPPDIDSHHLLRRELQGLS